MVGEARSHSDLEMEENGVYERMRGGCPCFQLGGPF